MEFSNIPLHVKDKVVDRICELMIVQGMDRKEAIRTALDEIDETFKTASSNAIDAMKTLKGANYHSISADTWKEDLIGSDYAVEIVDDDYYYMGSRVQETREIILQYNKPVCVLIKRGAYRDTNHFALYNIIYEKEYTDLPAALAELSDWLEEYKEGNDKSGRQGRR